MRNDHYSVTALAGGLHLYWWIGYEAGQIHRALPTVAAYGNDDPGLGHHLGLPRGPGRAAPLSIFRSKQMNEEGLAERWFCAV